MIDMRKCAVIGCGFVGSSSAFALMESRLFNEIVLIDANKKKAEGEAMDISHGMPYVGNIDIYAGDYKDIKDAGIIVITAGAGQKPGETRLDLVNKNVEIFKSIIPAITEYNKEAILLVVSNPVDILTYVTLKLSGFPKERVIGSGTVLDSARLKYVLGRHLDVNPKSVHAYIIGEHGDSELAVWSSANISGIPISDFCELRGHFNHNETEHKLFNEVKNSAYEIIERKGATYYGIALSVRHLCQCIVNDEHSILPVSSYHENGYYDISGVCMSVPTIVGQSGIQQVLEINLDHVEKNALKESARALKSVIDGLDI